MVIYEIALNAIEHGASPNVELESKAGVVAIRDTGTRFGLEDLRAGGRGGHQAVKDLTMAASGTFSLVFMVSSDKNEWFIVDQVVTEGVNTPCALVLPGPGPEAAINAPSELARLETCHDIHLYPGRLWSYSDFYLVMAAIRYPLQNRRVVIHGVREDSPLGRWLVTLAPNVSLPD
jgi:hypothetical protein